MLLLIILLIAPLVLCVSMIAYGAAGYYQLNEQPFWVVLGVIGMTTIFLCIAVGWRYVNEEPRPIPVMPMISMEEKDPPKATMETDWSDAKTPNPYRVALEESLRVNPVQTEQQMHAIAITEEPPTNDGFRLVMTGTALLVGVVVWLALLLCAWRVGRYMRPKLLDEDEENTYR